MPIAITVTAGYHICQERRVEQIMPTALQGECQNTSIQNNGRALRFLLPQELERPSHAASIVVDANGFRLTSERRMRAASPGQALVLYRGDEVVGGGTIERASNP